MVVVWSVLTGLCLVQVVRRLVALRRPRSGSGVVESLALRAGLPMPTSSGTRGAALQERVLGRLLRRDLAAACGGLVAAVLVLAVVLVARAVEGVDELRPPPEAAWVPLLVAVASLLAGRALASVLVAAHQAFQPPVLGASRVARARSPRLVDYVPRLELGVVRLLVGLTVAAAAVTALAASQGRVPWTAVREPAVASVVLVAVLVALDVVSRRVLAQQQPAGDALELAWDDVLRGQLLRDLATLPLALGLVAFLQGWAAASAAWGLEAGGVAVAVPVAGMALAVAALLVGLVRPAEERSRRRLWPDADALLVGEDVGGVGTSPAAGWPR